MTKQNTVLEVKELVERFQLKPHPEGGFYSETYRDPRQIQTSAGPRNASTAIYYLLDRGAYSAWHRIASDELWHFYAGAPLLIHVLDESGTLITHRLGNAMQAQDASFQISVPARHWFAAELEQPDTWALVGCTVAPGFEFSEFELAGTAELLKLAPEHQELIQRLAAKGAHS